MADGSEENGRKKKMTQGLFMTAAGIVLAIAVLAGALTMAVTGKGQRRKLEEKMKKRYGEPGRKD